MRRREEETRQAGRQAGKGFESHKKRRRSGISANENAALHELFGGLYIYASKWDQAETS